MKRIIFFTLLTTVLAIAVIGLFISRDSSVFGERTQQSFVIPTSPVNASYRLGTLEVPLQNGVYENEEVSVSLVNEYVSGDIDGDGDDDAVLILKEQANSSSPQYHLGLALFDEGGYLGLTTVPLDGEPATIRIRDELIEISYQNEDTVEEGQIRQEQYFTINSAVEIIEIAPKEDTEIFRGIYSYNTSDAFFAPCGEEVSYRLSSDSNSLVALRAIADERKGNTTATSNDVYVVLTGTILGNEEDGAQKEEDVLPSERTFLVQSIVRVPTQADALCFSTSTEETVSP